MIHVPEGTFIHTYMKHMEELETPRIYDFMCACWCLSNTLGRSVIVDRPRAPVHLNMYVILVSESGIMRKSTSIRIATSIVRAVFQRTDSKTLLIESKANMGMILNELSRSTHKHGQAHMVFVASELAASFGRVVGSSSIIALLTDLYDCPDVRVGGGTTTSDQSYNLKDIYMSFLGGTTPAWLDRAVTPTVIEGGFTSRCYFTVGKQRKRTVAWPSEQLPQTNDALIQMLQEIQDESRTHSRIGVTTGAKDTFTKWYGERILHNDTYRESFESREDAHVLRFAGLFAANERCWQINDDHIRRAIECVGNLKDAGTGLFVGDSTTSTTNLSWLRRVRQELIKAGSMGISKNDLSHAVNPRGTRTAELRATLHTMHELDLIQVLEVKFDGFAGRPKTVYKATPYLANEQFMDDVVRKVGMG